MSKCRNCFKDTSGGFCSTTCKEKYTDKYLPKVISNDARDFKTYQQYMDALPSFDDIAKGKNLESFNDLNDASKKPTLTQSLEALPTFEELQSGQLL